MRNQSQTTPENGNPATNDNRETALKKDWDEVEEINKKQEERIHKLETKALQLTNLYFVFQGVILSTIATKKLDCERSWIPFVLSLLAALINTAALCHAIYCFVKCSEELDQNREDLRTIKERRLTRAQMADLQVERPRPDPIARRFRRVGSAVSIVLFAGFSGVILYGCFGILC